MRDLLSERWEAVVRCAVTGRNESASADVTAINWLGAINPDWPVTSIGRVSRTYMGTTFPHAYQGSDVGDIPFIKVGDFGLAERTGLLSSAGNWVTRRVADELGARILPAQSIIYARVGAALLLNQRRLTGRESIVDDNVRGLAFRVGDPRYWRYLLTLLDLGQVANPGPVPSVSESQVSSVLIPLPPSSEQVSIANELDDLNATHLKLSENLASQVSLLQERRQALITAAVTGQIDVTTARGGG